MDQRIIFHVDCDYFFAQCEEIRKTHLKGLPVVVCVFSGRTPDSGVVGTANYEARKLGIRSGMPIAFAKRKASSETVFLPVDMPYYSAVSEKIMNVCRELSEKIEKIGLDEAYLDVSQKTNLDYKKARQIALELKQKIFAQTSITVSVGVAPNKLLAKIASSKQKPNGLTIVKPGIVNDFLESLPVTEIPGIGQKTADALKTINVGKIKDLSLAPREKLVAMFGKAKGTFLHNASLGVDETQVLLEKPKKRLSVIRTLKKDSTKMEEIAPFLEDLSRQLNLRAVKEGVKFKRVGIIAIDTKLEMTSREKTLPAFCGSLEDIFFTAKSLFEKLFDEKKELTLRRAGISVSVFEAEQKQRTLGEF